MIYLQKVSDDSNLTVQSLPPPTGSNTATQWEKLSTLQMAQLPTCNNVLTCRDRRWRRLITSSWGDSKTSEHTRVLPVGSCTDKQGLNKGVSVQTKTDPCNRQSRRSVSQEVADWENNRLKKPSSASGLWQVHKLGEIEVRITIWQAAGRHPKNIGCHFYFQLQLRTVWQTTSLFSIILNQPKMRFTSANIYK